MNLGEDQKASEEASSSTEREHMFDKVVTPSDVGKLNRLVIPKQHAERYFPLDNSTTNDNNKGLLLNFEDRSGNSWRFRYSYWNSSQSYVMTKGWSRFVKDKKLDAGDIVSFQRASGNKEKLFIDWRRRPKIPDHHQTSHQFAGAMFPRFYSFPHQMPTNYETHNLYHRFHQRDLGIGYYVRSMERNNPTAVIESVPVLMQRRAQVPSRGGEKRLRLFGVDMECGSGGGGGGGGSVNSTEEESSSSGGSLPRGGVSMPGAGSFLQLRLVSSDDESLVAMEAASVEDHHFFSKKGKSSLSFDLDR